MTGDELPALFHLGTEDNYVSPTRHIFIIQSCHAFISRFSESVETHLKNHCKANPLKGIFLTKGNVFLYHTNCIFSTNKMKFSKRSPLFTTVAIQVTLFTSSK